MYNIILLDADDTLFDFEKAETMAFERSFQEMHKISDLSETFRRYKIINKELWSEVEKGTIDSKQLRVERFRRLFLDEEVSFTPKEFSDCFIRHLSEGAFLIDGAEELCRYLNSKYILVIVTNGIKEVQQSRLQRSSIKEYITNIVISEEVGVSKPDPGIFEFALKQLHCEKSEGVLMIGDSLSSDIQGGSNAGIHTCWYNPKKIENSTTLQPTYQIHQLDELYKLL